MKKSLHVYNAFTLLEILVVMGIVVILGGLSLFGFGGLRDTVLVNQSFADIKQDVQQIQQDSMLLQKSPDEGWIYGIGIDFNNITSDGTYSYFKWCSGFANFGSDRTKSEIPGWDGDNNITDNNGFLPVGVSLTDCSGTTEGLAPYTGYENGKLLAGYNTYLSLAKYVLFESSTGRVFLYDQDGQPVNYTPGGLFEDTNQFAIAVEKNQGKLSDALIVAPLSGEITRVTDTQIERPEGESLYESTAPVTIPEPDPYVEEVVIVPPDEHENILPYIEPDRVLPIDDGRRIDLWEGEEI